ERDLSFCVGCAHQAARAKGAAAMAQGKLRREIMASWYGRSAAACVAPPELELYYAEPEPCELPNDSQRVTMDVTRRVMAKDYVKEVEGVYRVGDTRVSLDSLVY